MIDNADLSKKIYFLLASFKLGGTERTASRIGMELMKRGHNVKFILLNGVFQYPEPELKQHALILSTGSGNKLLRMARAWTTLRRILNTQKPDVLISTSTGFNLLGISTFYQPLVLRIESNIFIYTKKLYRRYLQKYAAYFPAAKKIVVPSKGLYDACKNYFPANDKLALIANPIETEPLQLLAQEHIEDFPQLGNAPFIVSAGRLHAGKGFAQLLSVFAKSELLRHHHLVILGDGPQKQELVALAKNLDVEERFHLPGFQENPYRFYARAHFFVLNSRHESFGNVIIESMAVGTPVLSNDCDFGPRYIIQNQQGGALYNQANEPEFLAMLEKCVLDAEWFQERKQSCADAVSRFKIGEIVDQWEQQIIHPLLQNSSIR